MTNERIQNTSADEKNTQTVDIEISEKKHQNDALDEALKESFPASDPVAINFNKSKKKNSPQK